MPANRTQVRTLRIGKNRIFLIPAEHTMEPDFGDRRLVDQDKALRMIPEGVHAIGREGARGFGEELMQYDVDFYKPGARVMPIRIQARASNRREITAFLEKAKKLKALVLFVGANAPRVRAVLTPREEVTAIARNASQMRLVGLNPTDFQAKHLFQDFVTSNHLMDVVTRLQKTLGHPVSVAYVTHPDHVEWINQLVTHLNDGDRRRIFDYFEDQHDLRCPIFGFDYSNPAVVHPSKLKYKFKKNLR